MVKEFLFVIKKYSNGIAKYRIFVKYFILIRLNMSNINNNLYNENLFLGIQNLIETSKIKVAITLNSEITCLYWNIGNYIITEIKHETYANYGKQILATLSQRLTKQFGKGYTYTALIRMIQVAQKYREIL